MTVFLPRHGRRSVRVGNERYRGCTIAALVLFALAMGCTGQPPKPSTSPAVPLPQTAQPTPPPKSDSPAETTTATPADSETPSAAPSPVAPSPAAAESTEEPPLAKNEQRVLMLAPGGPWLVGFQLTIDGSSPTERLQKLGQELLAACDTNADGEVTWEELTLAPAFRSGQFGSTSPQSETARLSFIQERDRNRNKVVDGDEIAGIFSRDGMSMKAFTLTGFRQHNEGVRTRSELYRLLDSNGDGSLTKDEWQDANKRLWSRDANDDEHVTPDEFRRVASRPGMMATRRRGTGPEMAWLIDEQTDWESLLYTLQETYSSGEPLSPEHFPRTPELFHQLDKNGNKRISLTELKELTSVRPHVVWQAAFTGETQRESSGSLPLTPIHWSSELGPRDTLHTVGATQRFSIAGLNTQWFVREAILSDDEQRVTTLLATYDNDKNGYLSDDELEPVLSNLGVELSELDANDNEKVERDELMALVRRRSIGQGLRVRVQVDEPEDLLFEFLDDDHDGRLNGREIEAAPKRLESLDQDHSGELADQEVPAGWLIAVVRGDAPDRPAPPPAVVAVPASTLPAWFQRMDANGDGKVSHREWLGTLERFKKLDADGDGQLTWDEVKP